MGNWPFLLGCTVAKNKLRKLVEGEKLLDGGRSGLDPSTMGFILNRLSASVDVHFSWLDGSTSPLSSAEVQSNLGLMLQDWLHDAGFGFGFGFGVVGATSFSNSNGEKFELRIEN